MANPLDDGEGDPLMVMQHFLDHLSQEPGAIIYRDKDIWRALPPGLVGDVLIMDENGLPAWFTESE